jgi:hypothetical protein
MATIEDAREAFLSMIADAKVWKENVDGDTDANGRSVMYIDYDLNIGAMELECLMDALGIDRHYTESLKDAIDRWISMPAADAAQTEG